MTKEVLLEGAEVQKLLDQLVEQISSKRVSDIRLAELVYQLSKHMDWETFDQLSKARGFSELLRKHQWKAYIRVYEYWSIQAKIPLEDLATLGITKLHAIAQAKIPPEQAYIWKEKALSLSSRKLYEEIRKEIRSQPLREPFRQISVPESVYESFQRSLARVRSVMRDSKISPISYLAWVAEYFLTVPESLIRDAWQILHGEYSSDHDPQ